MDPIKEGKEIFSEVAKSFPWTSTEDLSQAKAFLNKLFQETKGLVIVDFLDTRNWDRIDGIEIMNDFLILKWHDYRNKKENGFEKEMRVMAFPFDLYAAFIHFNELRIINTKSFPLVFIRGFAIKDKEIKKKLVQNPKEFKFYDFQDNFSKMILVKRNGFLEEYLCLTTPIFSSIILPKGLHISPSRTSRLLYDINLIDSNERLNKIKEDIEKDKTNNKDFICEKANTARRIFEYVLKVECCYRYKQIDVRKDYSNMLLGNLVGLLKDFREEHTIQVLNKIVEWSNELSHESGKPIKKEKALSLIYFIMLYTDLLRSDIKVSLNPHVEF